MPSLRLMLYCSGARQHTDTIALFLRGFNQHSDTASRQILCALVIGFSPMTIAADLPSNELKDIERIVTTATRIETDSSALPYIVSAIREESLQLAAPVHIEQVLKFVAGVGVQRGNGQEYLPAIRSQVFSGAGACGGLLTAEDGIPLRAAGFCNINELFEAHSEVASRIEVVKGPGAAVYGSNAVHGVINVITPDTTTGSGMSTVDVGSYGYKRLRVNAGQDRGDYGFGLSTSLTRDSGYRDDEGVNQDKVSLRYRKEWDGLSITSGLTYVNLDQDTAGFITGFESYKDETLSQRNENPEAFRKAQALRAWTRAQWQINERDRLVITPYFRNQSMDFRMHFIPGTPLEINTQKGVGVQSLYQTSLSDTWQFDTGIDVEYTEGALSQVQQDPTPGSAFLQATIPQGRHYDYDVDATLIAPFASLVWRSDSWTVQAGLRLESMRYDYTNNMLAGRTREDGTECGFGGCRYARPPSRSDDFNNASPKLGISYRFSPSLEAYANLSAGYRAPQATELYRLQRAQQVADLDTEQALNREVGIRQIGSQTQWTLALYSMDKDNVIYRDSDFFNVANGQTRHEGVELELKSQLFEHVDLALAASYARHTYRNSQVLNGLDIRGNDIDSAPRTLVNSRLGWTISQGERVELEWQHVGDYYTDPENLNHYGGHNVFHLRGVLSIANDLTLFARVINLTDKRYAERADFTSFSGARYFPGLPRHFVVSIQYQW